MTREGLSLDSVLEIMPGFISWVDKDLVYLGVNDNLAHFFNKSPGDFIGKKVGEVTPDHNEFLIATLKDLFSDPEKNKFQCELEFYKETTKHVSLLTIKTYDNNSKALLVSIDITELKETQQKLESAQKMAQHNSKLVALGELSATISHEINNPLSLISGTNSILKKAALKNNVDINLIEKSTNRIDKALDKIYKIIKSVKKLVSNPNQVNKSDILVKSLIDDLLIFQQHQCEIRDIYLEYSLENESLLVFGNEIQIGQVLVVLINNAMDAIEELENKWIKIEVKEDHGNIKFLITDSGAGIPQDIAAQMFDSFFTTKKLGRGSGIGLDVAKNIIELHHGKIYINHNHSNTQFVIELPQK